MSLPLGSFQRPTIVEAEDARVLEGEEAFTTGGDGGRKGGRGGGGVEDPKPKIFLKSMCGRKS